ncbi:hypothetical protein FGM00_18935 [Aggregatimonas sangjinii]|uniref:STAS/SEC14 domain-containing protein n=1 Tax=Aggregatimonas sangjinii TaxID=2583587 RepID=A0A5B7SYD1_9FLAO|nr:hypothetical protein [Aggregatimonas sangjinii]QCX02088.1 hypothetical protein FGM00_18935 [Aggregatimonas sangjinii]
MGKVKDSIFYQDAIHEINYPFGDYYLFDGFVIAEVHEDVIFTWKNHGKKVTEDLTHLYDSDGRNVVFITNRVNTYSVKPADWIYFFKQSYTLKGYAVVSYSNSRYPSALLEKLFMKTKFRSFKTLQSAIEWARGISDGRMAS